MQYNFTAQNASVIELKNPHFVLMVFGSIEFEFEFVSSKFSQNQLPTYYTPKAKLFDSVNDTDSCHGNVTTPFRPLV